MEVFLNNIDLYLQASMLMSFTAAFTGGILASFTPCVYPMVPITASFVGSRNLGGSKTRGFLLSFCYVFGIAITYTAMGIIAVATGRLFGEINSSPLAYFIVANIMMLLGLGMLDVFSIPMFSFHKTPETGGIIGIIFVGMATGLVAGPCTAPVLGVLLTYVATTHNFFLGGSLLFAFAMGMGIILILVGTFSAVLAAIPKSGAWMVNIKKILGFIMIGLGEYFLIKAGHLMI